MADDAHLRANRKVRIERKEAHLRALHDRYTRQVRAVGDDAGPVVARAMHEAMDRALERDRRIVPGGGDIRCARGCHHCCRGPVEIGPHEAARLVEEARAAGLELDVARLERQSKHNAETWHEQPPADRACIFLGGDGACRVYEARPNACRKLLVMSDPEWCDADRHPPERVERWLSGEAEMMAVAALEVFGAGLMPRLLLKAMMDEG